MYNCKGIITACGEGAQSCSFLDLCAQQTPCTRSNWLCKLMLWVICVASTCLRLPYCFASSVPSSQPPDVYVFVSICFVPALPFRSAVIVFCWCRAGQELGPSAALLPIKHALASLQSSLQARPSSNPFAPDPVVQELLEQLSQAALFHELCSGDLQAVPGLMTPGSRLNCLMQLLQDEASATSASTGADSSTASEAASVGRGESSAALPSREASAA